MWVPQSRHNIYIYILRIKYFSISVVKRRRRRKRMQKCIEAFERDSLCCTSFIIIIMVVVMRTIQLGYIYLSIYTPTVYGYITLQILCNQQPVVYIRPFATAKRTTSTAETVRQALIISHSSLWNASWDFITQAALGLLSGLSWCPFITYRYYLYRFQFTNKHKHRLELFNYLASGWLLSLDSVNLSEA